MRIDLLITELFAGGAERCLAEVAIGLQQRGHQVRVISIGRLPKPPQDLLVRRFRKERIACESLNAGSKWSVLQATYRLIRLLGQDPPDLMQTFLHHANVLGALAGRISGTPICVGGVRVAQNWRFRTAIERRAMARMDGVVCVSDSVRDFAQNRLIPPGISSCVIHNGIDLGRYADAVGLDWESVGLPNQAKVALFLGRLDPQKGLPYLFKAAHQFLAEDPTRWLVLAGDGPQRSWAEEQCRKLPQQRGRVLGWRPDVPDLLGAAHLLVLSSVYEGMPNVVLEAMAAGKPVVCRQVEGVHELLASGAQCQIVQEEDPDKFASKASLFFEDPEMAHSVGSANQHRAAADFNLDHMVDAYLAYYDTLGARVR